MPGIITTIKDLVVRVRFDEDPPSINELINVQNQYGTQLLVDHMEPGGVAFCLYVRSDLRLSQGMLAERTNK